MGDALRWGIIGTGGIAHAFVKDIKAAGLSVVAVGSRRAETAEAFGREFAIPHRHASYEALCADPEVDIVYVATPHPFHHANALCALRGGKHVLVEKPFTLNAREAAELVETARGRGLFLMEAMWTRFLPMMVALRGIIDAGTIGGVTSVLADHGQYLPFAKAARLHLPELGGGAVLDLGVYPISFAQMLLGPPSRILALGRLSPRGVDESVALALSWSGGGEACLQASMMAQGPNRAAVIGSLGRIEIDRVWYCQTSFTVRSREDELLSRYEEGIAGRGMQYQALEVETRIRAGDLESPIMSHRESLEVMATMDEVRKQVGVRYPGE